MWAVGRLAFLSRGRAAVNPKPDATPTPARPPDASAPPEPTVPGLLERIVLRVKGLFRSMFG
jgi:hypothetical protein